MECGAKVAPEGEKGEMSSENHEQEELSAGDTDVEELEPAFRSLDSDADQRLSQDELLPVAKQLWSFGGSNDEWPEAYQSLKDDLGLPETGMDLVTFEIVLKAQFTDTLQLKNALQDIIKNREAIVFDEGGLDKQNKVSVSAAPNAPDVPRTSLFYAREEPQRWDVVNTTNEDKQSLANVSFAPSNGSDMGNLPRPKDQTHGWLSHMKSDVHRRVAQKIDSTKSAIGHLLEGGTTYAKKMVTAAFVEPHLNASGQVTEVSDVDPEIKQIDREINSIHDTMPQIALRND